MQHIALSYTCKGRSLFIALIAQLALLIALSRL